MDEEHLRQRKAADGEDGVAAASGATNTATVSDGVPADGQSGTPETVAQSAAQARDAYFDALKVWLQQVQAQQMAATMFPYYLANCQQMNGGPLGATGPTFTGPQQYQPNPFYFPQHPAFVFNAPNVGIPANGMANAFGQQQQQQNPINGNVFNQNRNQDNMRRNEESESRQYFGIIKSNLWIFERYSFHRVTFSSIFSYPAKRRVRIYYRTDMETLRC